MAVTRHIKWAYSLYTISLLFPPKHFDFLQTQDSNCQYRDKSELQSRTQVNCGSKLTKILALKELH